ncbi:DUF1254 domain-containing protein [Methylopila sp. 73B]|uniref:DUF1254 domain-containing protein n=1 Tax=Methylopila sp. 73B TaxID=1120792 RepID=UPI000373F3F0|nr:DUF1254 domain-containing protein [Methylopila sp. 73B]
MMRLFHAVVVGLFLAGVVHVGSLLAVPSLAPRGPYDRLAALPADGRFVALPDDGANADLLAFSDPFFVVAACRYDLAEGPVTVRAALPSTYGAVAIHERRGAPFYALTDKAATNGTVEVVILRENDVAAAEEDETAQARPSIRIVSPTDAGFVLVRLFAQAPSARPALKALAESATCGRSTPPPSTP